MNIDRTSFPCLEFRTKSSPPQRTHTLGAKVLMAKRDRVVCLSPTTRNDEHRSDVMQVCCERKDLDRVVLFSQSQDEYQGLSIHSTLPLSVNIMNGADHRLGR